MGCGRCDAAPSLLSSCQRVGVGNACGADDQRELAGFATSAEIKKRKRAVSMHAARRRRRAATRSVAGSLAEAAAHCSRQMLSGSTLLRTRCCAGSCVCVDSIQILRYQTSARTLNECQVGVDYIAAKSVSETRHCWVTIHTYTHTHIHTYMVGGGHIPASGRFYFYRFTPGSWTLFVRNAREEVRCTQTRCR